MCLLRSSWNFYVFEGTRSFVVVNLIWGVELYTCISFLLNILSVPEVLSVCSDRASLLAPESQIRSWTLHLFSYCSWHRKSCWIPLQLLSHFESLGIQLFYCFVFHVSGSQTWLGGPPALDPLYVIPHLTLTHLIGLINSLVETAKTKLGVFDYGDMQNVQDRVGDHCFMWIHFEESTILYWNYKNEILVSFFFVKN